MSCDLLGHFIKAFAYRFQTADRRIVVSGDTTASDAISAACDGCDCECGAPDPDCDTPTCAEPVDGCRGAQRCGGGHCVAAASDTRLWRERGRPAAMIGARIAGQGLPNESIAVADLVGCAKVIALGAERYLTR